MAMSGSDERDENHPPGLEPVNHEKIQMSNNRFTRSLYSEQTGKYLGEANIFFPILYLVVGITLIGVCIFAIITMDGDLRAALSMGSCFLGGVCNLFGVTMLFSYITGTFRESRDWDKGRHGDEISGGDWSD